MEVYLAVVATLTLAVSCTTLAILHLSVRPERLPVLPPQHRHETPPVSHEDEAWAAGVVRMMEEQFHTTFSPERRTSEIRHLARTRRAR